MKLVEAQMLQWLGWVLHDHAMIVSGAYKLKGTEVGCGKNDDGTIKFRPCTEEEKLENAMQTMKAHLKLVGDCVDYIGKHQDPSAEQAKSCLGEIWDDLWGEPPDGDPLNPLSPHRNWRHR